MNIVIPMSGRGQRFLDKGYTVPKPLIEVDGMPIIEHVVRQFSPEDHFVFICANDHLETTPMRDILKRIAPQAVIVGIAPHKRGPIYAVQQAYAHIEDAEEVIVNYCDFGWYWSYEDFLEHTRGRSADGAIPAYKGFHPHMLGTTNYAFMRDDAQWMLEIQEKRPFTDNRMAEFASSGTYYFKSGALMKRFMDETVSRGLDVKGEYYVSVVYNLLVEAGLKVSIYAIEHMLQWGTPEDLEAYQYHSRYFRALMEMTPFQAPEPQTATLIPLAGEGKRFSEAGYETPKPLIELSGRPMIAQAFDSYPKGARAAFVVLKRHCAAYGVDAFLKALYPGAQVTVLDAVTEGQAITAAIGVEALPPESPLLIAACDNGILIPKIAYEALCADSDVDVICLTFRGHPTVGSNPNAYGYVRADAEGHLLGVSVKRPISEAPMADHAIVGAFYFKHARDFLEGVRLLKAKNIRVNGEFYIDSLMGLLDALGLRGRVLECAYESWGTPNDYETYRYWQRFFHKAPFHPYSMMGDPMIPDAQRAAYHKAAHAFDQEFR